MVLWKHTCGYNVKGSEEGIEILWKRTIPSVVGGETVKEVEER
jgi:hypothetical protein